ncbi:MAG TPA: DUF1080 domain-containing protein [Verrucomicrobiae bacterium]|jgi:hypothetical protein
MKYNVTRLWPMAVLLAAVAASAADLNTLTPEEKADGWKLLFDGTDTSGWRTCGRTDFPAQGWVIEDGALKNVGGKKGGDLVTREKFTDFDFKFEWRISPGGNSGVKYLVTESKNSKAGIGFEYQVLDDDKNEDAQNGPKRQAGALYYIIAPNKEKHLKPVGEFNEGEIIVRGNHVEQWLNGAKIVGCDLGSPSLLEAIAQSKFSKLTWFGKKKATVLLLQDHGDTAWYRNLKIKELKPE